MPKFTKATARAAAAKRRKKPAAAAGDIAPTSPPADEEPRIPASMHGGLPPVERATIVVSAPPPAPAPSEPPAEEPAAATPPASGVEVVEVTGTPFTPEVVKMFTNIVFDTVGVVTGKPHIWKLDEDELEPLAKPIGHQLSRIPLVRALGPDNTELVICVMGLGVVVTKRLNEHADEVQQERDEKARRLAAGGGDIAARSSASPAPSTGPAQDFATEGPRDLHIGMRAAN